MLRIQVMIEHIKSWSNVLLMFHSHS